MTVESCEHYEQAFVSFLDDVFELDFRGINKRGEYLLQTTAVPYQES